MLFKSPLLNVSSQTSIGTMKWKYKSIEKKGAMSNFSMLKKYMAIHF